MFEYESVKVNTNNTNRHYYDVVGTYAKSGWRLHQVMKKSVKQSGHDYVELVFERELNE